MILFIERYPGLPVLLGALLFFPFTARELRSGRWPLRAIVVALLATAALALLLAFANLGVGDYVDRTEPAVVGNAWIWWHGGHLYPSLSDADPELRGLLYGPLTFVLAGIGPMLLGPSVFASKLPSVVLFVGVVALEWLACRRSGATPWQALLATAVMTALLGTRTVPYWMRGDVVLMVISAASVCLVARSSMRPVLCAVALGALAGTASAIKIHGAAYVAPACVVLLVEASGWPHPAQWGRAVSALAAIAVAAIAAVAWPFGLPGISLQGYATYLQIATRHGLSAIVFVQNLILIAAVCLPILLFVNDGSGKLGARWMVLAWASLSSAIVVAVIAAKPGAGYPHLLPFLPNAGLLLARALMVRQAAAVTSLRLVAIGALVCLTFCLPVAARGIAFVTRSAEFRTIDAGARQIAKVMAAHPGQTVEVGYGAPSFVNERLSYLRVIPVFAGNPLLYDEAAMSDLWLGGIDRELTLNGLDRCRVRVWLIPGAHPFADTGYGMLDFPDSFRRMFLDRYRQESSAGPFQVWVCNSAASADSVNDQLPQKKTPAPAL